jgi:phenylpropionate dioxygenase-like ring-hydroxylating dioxygenase large terminal subunit
MRTPDDLFNPAHYAATRLSVDRASNLPPWCYVEPAFFDREIEQIFRKEWLCVARAEQIASAGDYLTLEIAKVPLLLVRDRDGVARAFSNTCRHRGCIVARGAGNRKDFVCPYHSWLYTLDGQLLSAPTDMEDSVGFDKANFNLIQIRLESWGGFLFVNFTDDAPDLSAHLGNLPELLRHYGCETMRLGRRLDFDVACNWKFYVENLKDAHHVASVHARSINAYASTTKYWREVQATTGNVVSTFMGFPGSAALLRGEQGFPEIESLKGHTPGTVAPLIFPNMYLSCTMDCAWYIVVHPVAVDRCRVEQGAVFPASVFDRPDFREIAPRYYRRFDMTQAEDNEICELQHRGLLSPYAVQGRYSARERLVHKTVNWILDRVLAPV